MKSGGRLNLWPEKGEPREPIIGEVKSSSSKLLSQLSFDARRKSSETGWGKSHFEKKRKVAARFTKSWHALDTTSPFSKGLNKRDSVTK
jgi:hypothetical protein